jgi:D-3-phosphoglycerate dehydrogenase (EC 1.1.1.95)
LKVLIAERISDAGLDELKKETDVEVRLGLKREKLLEIIKDFDALIVRSEIKVDSELMEAAPNLKVVGRAGNGIDNIDLKEATRRGIIVVNTPDSNAISAAEHTIGLIIAIARNIPQAAHAVKSQDFHRNKYKGVELYGKTLGIIGLGRIGSLVAKRMKAFEMEVIAYDPYISSEIFDEIGVKKAETLEDLLRNSDIITIHTPKTRETVGMIGEKELAITKKGVRIVNCARGGLINERALCEYLKSGHVAAAAIDVLEKEPSYEGDNTGFYNPLIELPNVVITPHLGASTVEAQNNVGITVAREVLSALKGQFTSNACNIPSIDREMLDLIRPYMKLAEIMGSFYYQIESTPVKTIEVLFSKGLLNTEILTNAILMGLLYPIVEERVNFVNSRYLCMERGIQIIEGILNDGDDYSNLIDLKIVNEKGQEVRFKGTVYGRDEIKIVEYMGYDVNFEPAQYMLFIRNEDKPGVIGYIGNILGEYGVNIATMHVTRRKEEGLALMMLGVDSPVPDEAIYRLVNVNGIITAKAITLNP